MKLGKKIHIDEAWKELKVTIMVEGLRKKFDQNPVLKEKLLKIKGKLYEATYTEFWGAGFVISQAANISDENVMGGNVLGKELVKLRDEYIAAEKD